MSLAEQLFHLQTELSQTVHTKLDTEEPITNQIQIEAKRTGTVPGTHTVTYNSNVDSIEIKHTAQQSRRICTGAVIAAEWIVGKQGVFTMKDVLELK
jgi:4-hydroxy-tetrahydrodipicolinate reductase